MQDIFIVSFEPNGKFKWAKSMGGTLSDYPISIALGDDGSIYNSGDFIDAINFDSSVLLSSPGSSGLFLQKIKVGPLKMHNYSDSKFSLSPNPVSNILIVDLKDERNFKNCKIEIFDITGKVLISECTINTKTTINTISLKPGTYFARLSTPNYYLTQIIMKN